MKIHKTLDEAIKAGYVIRNGKDYGVSNQYWRWCSKNTKPFVAIKPRRKYAYVEIDLGYISDDGFSDQTVNEIFDHLRTTTKKPRGWSVTGGNRMISIQNIFIEEADKVARYFYEIGLKKGNLLTEKEYCEKIIRDAVSGR